LPAEIEQRIDSHYERFLLNGDHLLHGRTPLSGAIHLTSNDYLCLSGEKSIVDAQIKALGTADYKDLLMSSSFLYGTNPVSVLEANLAAYLHAEDGIVCQSGWSANVSLLQTIASPHIPVYLDFRAHASMWEGARAAGANAIPFVHNDMEHLERLIQKNGPGVIAVDSVYSTDGTLCPVVDLVQLGERNGCTLLVDESHSIGTHGPHGAGIVVQLNLQDRVQFRTASLAKAFAGRAGFITCSSRFKNYFACEARPAIFSSCLLNHELAGFSAAVEFLYECDDRRKRLFANARYLRSRLSDIGYNVDEGTEQIIALEAGPEKQTRVLRDALQKNGVFGSVFCAPATPRNRSLIRLTVNSGLTDEQLDKVAQVCESIVDEVGLKDWPSTRRKTAKR